ncbi:hypothetical protein [Streptomyces sp. CBMA29]|uniref:hypothetical protein n=1 Tax=Streptomyces sp. CBMA29 TaxID=1896314 RepID=UPI001661E3A9|nr:hypothetical protein [Streptomyces sp. CBMA29]MBD0734091.1 hypothetical protein [Streptomyces sp. CBMA29]
MQLDATAQQMLRDIVPCPEYRSIISALGCVPPGPEVDEKEHYASHMRLKAALPLHAAVRAKANSVADVFIAMWSSESDGSTHADASEMRALCRATGHLVVTHLIAAGLINVA